MNKEINARQLKAQQLRDLHRKKHTVISQGLKNSVDEIDVKSRLLTKVVHSEISEAEKKTTLFEIENLLIQLKADVEIFQNHLELEKEKFNATNT